ncbi:hypothetical protein ElyMa_002389500 [Elysia marginata]|uniref:Myb-like domain-containing protein n=1 Tax=Elysia marginata TaxID=1093978 RepID=A0AAV4GDA2_9GAST|nr:hypothetical protein ElyMa_002389500 [Elysia marginata]
MRKQNSLEQSIILGMGECGRRRGRPCMRWKNDIKPVTGLTLSELVRAVENRDHWRQLITTITRSRPRLDGASTLRWEALKKKKTSLTKIKTTGQAVPNKKKQHSMALTYISIESHESWKKHQSPPSPVLWIVQLFMI